MNRLKQLPAAVAAALVQTAAGAAVITLDFEGIADHPHSSTVLIGGYYDGGTASNGRAGPDLGVTFSPGATLLCLNTFERDCSNTSKGDGGLAGSRLGAMFFPRANPVMNVEGGFGDGFSMSFSNPFDREIGVEVYDGADGTGTLLASARLGGTANGINGLCADYGRPNYCPFADFSLGFVGRARSVRFTGPADRSVYDDITFGSVQVGGLQLDGLRQAAAVPEPAAPALIGLALAAAALASWRPGRARP